MTLRWRIVACVLAASVLGAATTRLAAQTVHPAAPPPPTSDQPESVTVVPGPQYHASGIRRWLAGARYRDLWTTPIRVTVLDLARYGGGLTPLRRGGGSQTVSLHMLGADGIEYVLRSVDKHPSVPEELRGTVVEDVVRDENSAANPSAALIVAPLLTAAGVLHVTPHLAVIPDDARLGAFRSDFAGMLVQVEGRPRTGDGEEGFTGASKVENTEKLLASLADRATTRIDARGYLTARLMDMYVGDWDRGESQWRWAHMGEKGERVWRPIPLDRDWAFVRYDGFLNALLRLDRPELIVFENEYPAAIRLMFQEWQLDRRLLQGLERAVFDSTARWLQQQLTDSVIDAAVAQMPPEQQAKRGAFLERALCRRRDQLPTIARRYYLRMADGADVHATAEPTVVDIDRRADTVEVRLRRREDDANEWYFVRRFVRGETHEVRLYLAGGHDSITVRGSNGPLVRVITAPSGSAGDANVLVDSAAGGAGRTIVYDSVGSTRVAHAHTTRVDDRSWTPPAVPRGTLVRDDGSRCLSLPWLGGSSDVGLAVGAVLTCDKFGFRQQPFAIRHRIIAGYATQTGGGLFDYVGQFHPVGSENLWSLRASASSADFTRYFGVGNETRLAGPEQFYRAHQQYYELTPAFDLAFGTRSTLTIGPNLRYWDTGRTFGKFLGVAHPYGLGAFGTVAGIANWKMDTRDAPAMPRQGVVLDIGGRGVPAWWGADRAYGQLHGLGSTYLTAGAFPLAPTLALRAGGEKVWGTAPYQDLAHIGARTAFEPFSVRGYYPDRFSGDASAFGTAQLELTIAHPKLVVPADIGILGFNDIGRVFAPGEHSSLWHDGVGGGLWAAWLHRAVAASAVLAHGTDGNRLYVGFGTGF